MDGQVAVNVYAGCISEYILETIRCRELIFGRDIA